MTGRSSTFFLLVKKGGNYRDEKRKVYENRKESSGTRIRGVIFSEGAASKNTKRTIERWHEE